MTNTKTSPTAASKRQRQNQLCIGSAKCSWTCPPILIDVSESFNSDEIIQIDIVGTIHGDKGKNVPSCEKLNDDNCYWFAKIFNCNTDQFRSENIFQIIKAACKDAGFVVNCKYKQLNDGGCIFVRCCRGAYYRSFSEGITNKNDVDEITPEVATVKKAKRNRKTTKPVKGQVGNDESCPFQFRIYWNERRQRWFIPKVQRGNKMHCGHVLGDVPSRFPTQTHEMPENDSAMQFGDHDECNSDVSDDTSDISELVGRFSSQYNEICNYADSCGDSGVQIMKDHFQHCQYRFLNFFHDSEVTEDQIIVPKKPHRCSTARTRFMDPFKRMCDMAEKSGRAGVEVLSEELNACQQELIRLKR